MTLHCALRQYKVLPNLLIQPCLGYLITENEVSLPEYVQLLLGDITDGWPNLARERLAPCRYAGLFADLRTSSLNKSQSTLKSMLRKPAHIGPGWLLITAASPRPLLIRVYCALNEGGGILFASASNTRMNSSIILRFAPALHFS